MSEIIKWNHLRLWQGMMYLTFVVLGYTYFLSYSLICVLLAKLEFYIIRFYSQEAKWCALVIAHALVMDRVLPEIRFLDTCNHLKNVFSGKLNKAFLHFGQIFVTLVMIFQSFTETSARSTLKIHQIF